MKINVLTFSITAVIAALSTQSHAVYNLYKGDGLSLDVSGEINLHARNLEQDIHVQYTDNSGLNVYADSVAWAELAQNAHKENTDRRTRLGQDDGATWIEFRGTQLMNNDWRVTGTVGFGYYDSQTGAYLSNANLAIDKRNIGSLSVGRQYLHTGYVARTGTYTTLETYAGASARVDYTAIPNLHLSGYYNTPSNNDVHNKNTAEVEGWGLSASYRYPIQDNHSVRFAAGYSDTRANVDETLLRASNQVAVDSQAYMGSIEYRYHNFLAALDFGKKKEDLDGTVTDSADSDFYGIKLGYQFTPKFTMTAGFGQKDTDRTNKDGVSAIGTYTPSNCIDADCTNVVAALESFLFDKVEEQKIYLRGDYYLRDNVRIYGRIDQEEIQSKLNGQNFAKIDNTGYRIGLAFNF